MYTRAFDELVYMAKVNTTNLIVRVYHFEEYTTNEIGIASLFQCTLTSLK